MRCSSVELNCLPLSYPLAVRHGVVVGGISVGCLIPVLEEDSVYMLAY